MSSLLELTPAALRETLRGWGEPEYRADQILRWVYARGVAEFEQMTDLALPLRQRLGGEFNLRASRVTARSQAPDGTAKLLLSWGDGATTECVMIPARTDARRTVCISTQVGCDVGCRFCASGLTGAARNLSAAEIVEQVLVIGEELRAAGERLSHVVYMGMGEPLANYRATVESIRRISAEWGCEIGQRKITVSTVGLPKQIERLAEEQLQVTLALSLHAANDALRRRLIPWAEAIPLRRLLDACKSYFAATGREITLEYCLLAGVNDSPEDAHDLATVARDLRAHINLLQYNPVPSLPFRRPDRDRAHGFLHRLRRFGANAHLRESRGLEADAACGQLRIRGES